MRVLIPLAISVTAVVVGGLILNAVLGVVGREPGPPQAPSTPQDDDTWRQT